MKKFILFFLLFAAVTTAIAYEENYWPRSYFIGAGMGIMASTGDLNERVITVKDTNGNKMKTYPPDINLMGNPELQLGVNIREFTLAISFQYWKENQELVKLSAEESCRYWRLGFEFTSNFFWPDYFQIGLGGGFSYTSLKTENSTFNGEKFHDTEFMGSGAALIANIQYFFSNNIAMVPSVKFYRNWFKNVYTKDSENRDLDPYLWQTFILGSISLQFQF